MTDLRQPSPLPRWRFWLSLLGAPVLWLVHFLLVYGFTEARCNLTPDAQTFNTPSTLIVNNMFILAALVLTWTIFRDIRRLGPDPYDDRTILYIGFASGLLFTFLLVMEALAFILIRGCA
jgi:hypothetical protein